MTPRGVVLCIAALAACGIALIAWLGLRPGVAQQAQRVVIAPQLADPVARGEYLARAANCRGCHTAHADAPYAGGRGLPTRFGVFYAPNLTPDRDTGLGQWSADEFWRALHEGRGRGGELLYPVFPYTHYTRMSRPDSDALYAYLRSLPAVRASTPEHALHFPYNLRVLLVAWRALFFRPGAVAGESAHDAQESRGKYLAQALGHCGACHESRNALGAIQSRDNPAGGVVLSWYAPSLDSTREAGVQHWAQEDVVALLRDGINARASTLGPMAEVVYDSLQHLHPDDLQAMAAYLRARPDRDPARAVGAPLAEDHPAFTRGARLYADHCADCHGERGEGQPPMAPALAGNRAVTLASSANPIRVVLYGGYAPGTAGNPQPFGMPPYHATLDDGEIAALLSYVRGAWGNRAAPVQDFEVARERTGPLW